VAKEEILKILADAVIEGTVIEGNEKQRNKEMRNLQKNWHKSSR